MVIWRRLVSAAVATAIGGAIAFTGVVAAAKAAIVGESAASFLLASPPFRWCLNPSEPGLGCWKIL